MLSGGSLDLGVGIGHLAQLRVVLEDENPRLVSREDLFPPRRRGQVDNGYDLSPQVDQSVDHTPGPRGLR